MKKALTSVYKWGYYLQGIRMKKIILGFMLLNGLVFGGDGIEINAPTVMCFNQNPEHGRFTLMAILAKDKESVKKGLKEDTNGDCRLVNLDSKKTMVGIVLEKQENTIPKNKLTKEVAFEHLKVKILTINGEKSRGTDVLWIVSFLAAPCYTIIK